MTGLVWLALSAVLFACDQAVKLWALTKLAPVGSIPVAGFLKFTYVENRGAAFGIFQGQTALLSVVTALILCGAVLLLFSKRVKVWRERLCLALIIAGGAGNLYDRVARGFVVDFIDINALFSYPMFNLADCFVVAGACLLILGVLLEEVRQHRKTGGEPAPGELPGGEEKAPIDGTEAGEQPKAQAPQTESDKEQ